MKSIISVLTFIFAVCMSINSYAQGQQQLGSELRPVSSSIIQSNSVVDPPTAIETVPSPQESSNEIKVIDGRKVHVDNKGIQSLAVPESIPFKNNEVKNPE